MNIVSLPDKYFTRTVTMKELLASGGLSVVSYPRYRAVDWLDDITMGIACLQDYSNKAWVVRDKLLNLYIAGECTRLELIRDGMASSTAGRYMRALRMLDTYVVRYLEKRGQYYE